MNWPFKRFRVDRDRHDGAAEGTAGTEAQPTRAWRRLPALHATVELRAPTLSGPALASPDLAGTRPLARPTAPTTASRLVNVLPLGGTSHVPAGTVTGLVRQPADRRPDRPHPRRRRGWAAEPVEESVPLIEYEREEVPARTLPIAPREQPAARPVLTRAVDEYVGEPVARRPAPAPEARPVEPQDPFFAAIEPFRNKSQGPTAGAEQLFQPPAPPVPTPQPESAPRQLPRMTLAQSRRLGLGQPTRRREASAAPDRRSEQTQAQDGPAAEPETRPAQTEGGGSHKPAGAAGVTAEGELGDGDPASATPERDATGAAPAAPRARAGLGRPPAHPHTPSRERDGGPPGTDAAEYLDVGTELLGAGSPARPAQVLPTPPVATSPEVSRSSEATTHPKAPSMPSGTPGPSPGGQDRAAPGLGLGAPLAHRRPPRAPRDRSPETADSARTRASAPSADAMPGDRLVEHRRTIDVPPAGEAPPDPAPVPREGPAMEDSAGRTVAEWTHPALDEALRALAEAAQTAVPDRSPDQASLPPGLPENVPPEEYATGIQEQDARPPTGDRMSPLAPERAALSHESTDGPQAPVSRGPLPERSTAALEPPPASPPPASPQLRHRRLTRWLRRWAERGAPEPGEPAPGEPTRSSPRPARSPRAAEAQARRRLAPATSAPTTSAPTTSVATTSVAAAEITRHTVPHAVASRFQQLHGVDVRHVPVLRGPLATRLARELDARAVTHRGKVFLPDEAGGLDDPATQALLAHELVHQVQQRDVAVPPAESSPEGQRMEAIAVATERSFRGERVPMAHLRLPATGTHAAPPPDGLDAYVRQIVGEVTEQRHEQALADAQRAPLTSTALSADTGMPPAAMSAGEQFLAVPLPAAGAVAAPVDWAALDGAVVVRSATQGLPGVLETLAEARTSTGLPQQVRLMSEETEQELRDTLRELRKSDLYANGRRDPEDLDDLAARLYGRIRGSLRHELLVDRERSGLLTDFR